MHATSSLAEADRLMTVCNSCRYCEGICAVFPALEMRQAFGDGDLNYLANLCHGCGACYFDCQFSPPHEFAVNLPKILSRVRGESYASFAWPPGFAPLFRRNGLAITIMATIAVALFIIGFAAIDHPATVFARHVGAGAFYKLMPHRAMALLFGAALLYAILAMGMGVRNFWRETGAPPGTLTNPRWLKQAVKDAASLRYLDGGGSGCMTADERPDDRRRMHHLTAYGFGLCFAATVVATLYHYLLGREAPYPWWDLPVLLGTVGGVGLVWGSAGLLAAKWRRHPDMVDQPHQGMEIAFIVLLLATASTGLLLLLLRETPAMGLLLSLHLAVVLVLFVTMPYGKFVHGLYRFAALARYARERHDLAHGAD